MLKTKPHLQVDPAVSGAAGEKPARHRVRFAKQRGVQVALGRGVIDVIEDVPCGDAEGQIEPAVRGVAPVEHIVVAHAAEPSRTQAMSASASTARTAPARAAARHFFAEANCFADAKVGSELVEASSVIGRNDGLSRCGHLVKSAPTSVNNDGGSVRIRGKSRAGIK